jgi:hypothetical protein
VSGQRAGFPIVLVGNQIAEYARLLAERDLLTCRAQMIRFGAWLGVARSHRRAGLLS